MRLFDHFDFLAPWYDRFISSPPDDLMVSMVGGGHARLLDVGCGTGRVSRRLEASARRIVLADPSLKMLRHARQGHRFGRVGATAEHLPFPEGCFDCVLMVDALHHVRHQGQSLEQMWRLVSPGGRLLVEEPDIRRFAVKMIALGEKLAFMHSHFLTGEQVAGRLRDLGAQPRIERKDHTVWVIADKPRL